MKTRKFAFTTFSLFIILAFVGLTTCEIGLGDSVDTEPPKVGISYPASTSIVRGSLQLTGTAEDETSLKKVEIYSAKKEGGKPGALVLLGDAELDKENNTWTFNTDTLKLEDGEYELTAKAYDNSKRPPASFTRSYIVDNTPPLLILDRPSTKGDLKELLQYDAFGADIIFSGAWYDENINAGGLLHIRFYDEQNEELADYSFELNQPTVNLILAEDTDDSGVWSSLANLASSEPKKLWYSIEVFDSAYEYNNPKEDASVVKTGNAASHYYLSRDVNNNLKPEDRYPNLSEFSAVVSGRSVAGFPSTLEDALKSIKIATGFDNDNNENRGSFSFDPGNKEPVISILALPIPSDEPNPSDNKLSPLPTLDIRIEPNKDGVAIDEDTIKISLTPFDDKGKLVNNKEVFENVKTGLIGTTLTVNLSLDKGEGSYQLELSAEDIQKHKVIRKYGFTINTGAPILDLVSPDRSPALTKINSTDDTFMVKVKGSDDSNRINLHITDEDNQAIRDIPLKGTAAGSSRFSFEWDVQLDAPKEGETKTFRFYLSDGDFESSKREITFLTDNTPPELISLVEPRLITEDGHVADGKSMVSNSTINVKGYASKDLEAVVFYITKDGQEPAQSLSGWVEGVRANNTIKVGEEDAREFTGTLPLSSFGHSAEDKYTLWARFADDTFDKELQNYGATTKLIDVIYDEANPVFTETESGITGTALVYKNKAVDFSGKISDGSGIASAVVKVNETEKSLVIDGASWSWTLAADTETHTKDGAYELEFIATDNVGKTTSFTRNVMIDTKAPTLDITAPTSGEGVSSNSYTIRGTVDDGEGKGVSTLEYSTNSTNGTDGTWTAITKAAAWSKTEVDFSGDRQGSRTLWVRASDGLNDADVKSVSFQYDTEDPELFETVSELEEGLVNRKDAVSFGGTASDTNELKSVTVSVNGETATAVTGTTNWSYTLPANVDHSNDGTYALVFTATDVAGRTFSVKRNVLIDTTAPTTPVFSTSKASYVTDSLAIAGIASDTGSGIETAYYRVDGNTEDPETGTLTGTDNWFATINTSGLLEGDHKVSVWTIDRAGNVSSEAVQDFTVDRANPEINSDAPASQATNKNITISGSASDSYQMGSVSVSLTKNGVSVASPNLNVTNTDDKTRTWSIAVNKDLGSGTYVYTIKATDSVGRTDSISRTVIIDVDAPTVTDLNLENNFLIRNDSYNVTGKAADNDGGTGVAKVEYKLDNGDWKLATGTDNWLVALSGLTDDLTKTFAVRATDNAGNVSVVESRTFKVDLADPDFTEKNSGIEGQSLVYKNKSVEFKGKVWDANGIESVTVKENGTEKNIDFTSAVSEPTETNWLWTLDAGTENHLKDGTYELVFTAEDTNGRTTSFTRNVMIDTKAPTVVIISPAEDEAVGSNSYTIRGTVDDGAGKGVSTLEYSTNSTNGTDGTWTAITKAAAWSKEGVDFSDGGQGEKTLWVRASDGLNDAVVESVFQYDTEDPSLSETTSTLGEALVNRKTAVTFGGTASDTNKLASLKLNGFGASEITIAVNEENKWTWTLPANVNHSNDGTYALVFTATDVAGRTTSIKRNVLIDTTPPTTPTFSTSEASYVTDSLAIAGTSSDDAGSGIATAYYRVNGNKGDAATATLTGTDNWFSTINISGLAEGDHKVSVWTVDRAGNKSDEKEQSFTIDRANPEITTDAPASQATNKDITISGSASDSYKMGSVSASYTISGDSTEVETQTETSLDEKSSTWSIAIDAGTLGSGTYVYTIKATDSVGRTASISRTVIIDVDAPTVAISNLNEDGSSLIQNNSFNVTGTASDVGLSGLKTVEYSVDGGTWNPVTGTDSWLVVLSGLTDGLTKTFAIRATDNAGNESVAVSRSYKVDLANPTFTETTSTIPGTALVYRNKDVAFGGDSTDGNGIASVVVTYKKNGGSSETLLGQTDGAENWSTSLPTSLGDGTYELEFIATDNVGKSTSFTRNIMIDTTAPTLDITSPTSGEGVSSTNYTIRGTVDDGAGKGVSTLEYSLDNTNWTAITKAAAWSATGVNFSSGGQGARTLWVRASDDLNDAVVKTVSFQYDTENPVLSETTSTLGEAQVNRNTAVSFGGTATDSNKLASLKLSGFGEEIIIDVNEDGEWSWTLPNTTNGTYALVFTATDVAGKTASIKRNVLIDTTKPILSEITTLTASWHKNATISVNGTASDTGSGLAKVEYQTRTSSSADWSAPQNFALNGNNFSGMVQFSDGATNEIRIRATDLAGNVSSNANQTGIRVDTFAPSFDITSPTSIPLSNGTGSLSISITATDVTSGVNKVYAKVGSSVWGTNITQYPEYEATINESGEASLTISDLSNLETGSQRIYLRVKDNAGHFSAVNSQTILIDTKPPTVNFSEPANSAKVNKTISLAGTANDTNGLAPEGHVIQIDNSGTWTDVVDSSVVLTGTNWTVSEFNTTAFTDESTIKIRVGIKDAAGNMGYAERSLSINQDGDRPVVRLTNVRPDGTTTLLNSSIVSGILLDDDGTVEVDNFAISEDGSDWTVASATALTANATKALFYDVDTRSFQYAPSSGDGEKTLYFRITDAAGTTFTTPASYSSEQLSYPKAQYSTEAITATAGMAVVFKVDTNPPDIHGDIHFDITDPFSFDGDGAVGDDYRLLNNSLFGGTKAQFALRIRAKDAVGIGNVNLTIGSNEITTTSGTTDAEGWTIFTTSSINVSTWTTGSYTVKLDVTDNSGQKSTSTREILVDNKAPTVEIISHNENEQVTGDLVFRGTAQDVGGAGLAKVEYQVGNDGDWKSVEGSFAWNIDFTQGNVITTTGSYANDTHATETSPGIWRLPIKIRVTDKAGNHETHTHYLNIDPDGDKPITTVLYPETGSTLGGTVRIFGSAIDNVRVDKVWMMIDVNDDGDYDSTDANYLSSKGYTVVQGPDYAYQFAVEGTASWNKSINGGGEFNPEGDTANPIRFKVRAQDNNGTYGNWSEERRVLFDDNVPQIGSANPLKLVQYSNPDGTGDIIAERDYIANMYIRGQWYLTGSVWDESGIKAISVTGSESATLDGSNTGWFVEDGTVGVYKNYQLKIPVGKSLTNETAGQLNYTIKVDDASEPSSSATANIYISYDNKAPVAAKIEHGEQEISTTNLITNSNRGFSMNSTVTEADSGFERLAFFFVRRGDVDRVYNPMYGTGNRTNISALTWDTGDIPRLVVSGLTRNGEDSLQSASLENNENIRVGGLVRIAGVDRIIQSVDYGTGTVTFSPAVSQDHKTAEFAYAQIVNNMLVETGNWEGNVLKTISNDDGDGMIEAVERSGGSYHWTATIDSKNIPDGPIELHYVAYDKAGNSVAGSVTSFVSNNRPRLAKVSLGTDLSGDGQFTSNEIVKYYEATTGEEESLVNLTSQDFIVKAKLAVIPEFVGGNGDLRYTWTTNGNAGDAWTGGSMPNEALDGAVANFTSITIDGSGSHPAIVIEPSELTTMDDKLKLFSFGIWDETEETTQGTDSQWALLNAPMLVDVVDGVAPKVVINPFYWKSATDNSLYENSKTNGHIELEADLPNPPFSGSSGLFDRDPKVSGQISIRGTAYDDVRLSALYVHFGDGTDSRFDFGTTETKTVDGRIYSRVATFNSSSGSWDAIDRWAVNGWKFSIIDTPENALDDSVYLDQRGHLIKWQLDIDTSRITSVARLDQLLRIVAEDANPNASSEATSGIDTRDDVTTNNVPSYQMDVVPYIRTIGSGLSKLKKNNPSVYNRTALGRYPVSEDETITVSGFNLGGDQSVLMDGYSSGPFTHTVNGVTTLNNLNSNTAEYNQLPNGDNNPHLTDDVILDVWQFNSTAVHSVDGRINEPVMKINPYNGIAGFAFANGVDSFSMANGTTNSYTHWQRNYADYGEVAFGFDVQGRSHGIVIGFDTEPNSGYTGRMNYITSRWGVPLNDARDNFRWNNKLRMESCGLPVGAQLQGEAVTQRIIDTTRFQSTSLAVASSDARTNPTLYLAYYDSLQEQIRFRWGTNNVTSRDNVTTADTGFGQFYDVDTASNRNSTGGSAYDQHIIFEPDAQYYSLIAGAENNLSNPTGNKAGEYVAIDVITGADPTADIVTVVWYDGADLWYTYRSGDKSFDANASSTGNAYWSAPLRIFEEAGLDCAISVDANGGVHIAAYDRVEGALRYAYLSSHNVGQDDVQTCIVDDYNIVGNKISITTVLDGSNNAIPYISYYAPSAQKPKLAYLVDPSGDKAPDGVNENTEFTGAWEISTIPTGSNVSEDRINVDLWRGANNRATNSTTGSSSSNATTGTVYGNGTSNPLAAYVINEGRRGYIETAQKK